MHTQGPRALICRSRFKVAEDDSYVSQRLEFEASIFRTSVSAQFFCTVFGTVADGNASDFLILLFRRVRDRLTSHFSN